MRDGIIVPPEKTRLFLNTSRTSAKTEIPLAKTYFKLYFVRHRLPISAARFARSNVFPRKGRRLVLSHDCPHLFGCWQRSVRNTLLLVVLVSAERFAAVKQFGGC